MERLYACAGSIVQLDLNQAGWPPSRASTEPPPYQAAAQAESALLWAAKADSEPDGGGRGDYLPH